MIQKGAVWESENNNMEENFQFVTKSSNTWLHDKCYQIQNKETDSELLYHKYQ